MSIRFERRDTKGVMVGDIMIGSKAPIIIQSMTNTDTKNIEQTVAQINALTKAGCEIVRVTVPDMPSAMAISKIKEQISIPLVADIHFDYRLALASIENGIDKLRINPGNIGDTSRVKEVVNAAKEKGIPIRIGVNGGSLEKELLAKYGGVTPEALVESASRHVDILEKLDFQDIIVSMKASNVPLCTKAYELFSEKYNYPVHVGITEAGTLYGGTIKSAVGLGAILSQGIGDTIRVSLTTDPVEEIKCARQILQALGIRTFGVEIISCPTCGRTKVDLIPLAEQVERLTAHIEKHITIAVMGCAVNGPGEAREADIGIAGGNGVGLIFKKGEIIKKVKEEELLDELMKEIYKLV
ncbi:MAG TPA: flavodoxin-dependent (E)-4-hydroxy-3-methylbut-2-enyl-diphosphate synthase [Epulopiscium sp.]|nr:flavodoxin-dependent (E)-4-hydroxy-3-methylbut-2-enyl-diphosphate synthase [Candidatus Epulonipiscium sp.]